MKKVKDSKNTYSPSDDDTLARLLFHTVQKLRHNGLPAYSQQQVLSILAEMGPLSQKKVQQILGVQPGSLSELCAKMEDKGLIERTRNEQDKRSVVIRITEKGRRIRREILDTKDDFLFSSLSIEERSQLRNLLNKLSADASAKEKVDFVEELTGRKEAET